MHIRNIVKKIWGWKSLLEIHRKAYLSQNYSILFMSRQSSSRVTGSGQFCWEPDSSVCVPGSCATVLIELAGIFLGSHSEDLTISIVILDSSYLPTRLEEEIDDSGEESLARSCKWSLSEPDSKPTLLHKPHRLCRVSSRFCSSSVRSCSSRSFSLVCKKQDGIAQEVNASVF